MSRVRVSCFALVATAAVAGVVLACATIPGFSAGPPGNGDANGLRDAPNEAASALDADAKAPPDVDGGLDAGSDGEASKCKKCMLFMTAAPYFGTQVGSKENADLICAAAAASLPGTWTALIWETNKPVPLTLVNHSSEGWYQVGPGGVPGEKVLTALTTAGRTDAGILTQAAQAISGATVWTGGDDLGKGANCGDWKDGGAEGIFGDPNTGNWLAEGVIQCSFAARRVYCIQQTP